MPVGGGAVFLRNSTVSAAFTNGTFEGNTASAHGGAIAILSAPATIALNISDSVFKVRADHFTNVQSS
jgi:predicted outer membrane repeat protein